MKRKVIQLAKKSYVVSLPSQWVKDNGIMKGEELEVMTEGNKLTVSKTIPKKLNRIEIDISDTEAALKKIVAAVVKAGYEEIEITFKTFDELKKLQDYARRKMPSFEVIHQTRNTLHMRSLFKYDFGEFERVLRRYFVLINHFSKETFNAFNNNDFEWLRQTILIKADLDKLSDYLRRAINLGVQIKYKRTGPLYTIVEDLLNVITVYREICSYVSDKKARIKPEIKGFLKDIIDYQEQFHKLFYSFDIQKAAAFGNKRKKLDDMLDSLPVRTPEEIKITHFYEQLIHLFYQLTGTVTTLNI